MVHTIALHCRLHNQAVGEALLPLVMKLGKGKELGKALKAKASGAAAGRAAASRAVLAVRGGVAVMQLATGSGG